MQVNFGVFNWLFAFECEKVLIRVYWLHRKAQYTLYGVEIVPVWHTNLIDTSAYGRFITPNPIDLQKSHFHHWNQQQLYWNNKNCKSSTQHDLSLLYNNLSPMVKNHSCVCIIFNAFNEYQSRQPILIHKHTRSAS